MPTWKTVVTNGELVIDFSGGYPSPDGISGVAFGDISIPGKLCGSQIMAAADLLVARHKDEEEANAAHIRGLIDAIRQRDEECGILRGRLRLLCNFARAACDAWEDSATGLDRAGARIALRAASEAEGKRP